MEVSDQLHAPAALPPGKEHPGTHRIEGWVGPRAVLDAVVKRKINSPRQKSNPRTPIIQPGAQRYTDWAVTAHFSSFLGPNILLSTPCLQTFQIYITFGWETKFYTRREQQLLLISFWISLTFLTVCPKYLICATFSSSLFAIFILWFCSVLYKIFSCKILTAFMFLSRPTCSSWATCCPWHNVMFPAETFSF
jgi:hypothetical protein